MSLESKDATCVGSLCERANSHGTRDFAGDTDLQAPFRLVNPDITIILVVKVIIVTKVITIIPVIIVIPIILVIIVIPDIPSVKVILVIKSS